MNPFEVDEEALAEAVKRYQQIVEDEESGRVTPTFIDPPPLPPLPTQEGETIATFVPKPPRT